MNLDQNRIAEYEESKSISILNYFIGHSDSLAKNDWFNKGDLDDVFAEIMSQMPQVDDESIEAWQFSISKHPSMNDKLISATIAYLSCGVMMYKYFGYYLEACLTVDATEQILLKTKPPFEIRVAGGRPLIVTVANDKEFFKRIEKVLDEIHTSVKMFEMNNRKEVRN